MVVIKRSSDTVGVCDSALHVVISTASWAHDDNPTIPVFRIPLLDDLLNITYLSGLSSIM